MIDDLLNALFSATVMLAGYPENVLPPPSVVRVGQQHFVITSCCGVSLNCKVLGNYRGGRVVFIHEKLDLNNVIAQSVLVHEYVHYLQIQFGKPHKTCRDRVNLELEAYEIQRKFLSNHGINNYPVTWSMVQSGCTKEELEIK